jgi:hypothetical protein
VWGAFYSPQGNPAVGVSSNPLCNPAWELNMSDFGVLTQGKVERSDMFELGAGHVQADFLEPGSGAG